MLPFMNSSKPNPTDRRVIIGGQSQPLWVWQEGCSIQHEPTAEDMSIIEQESLAVSHHHYFRSSGELVGIDRKAKIVWRGQEVSLLYAAKGAIHTSEKPSECELEYLAAQGIEMQEVEYWQIYDPSYNCPE